MTKQIIILVNRRTLKANCVNESTLAYIYSNVMSVAYADVVRNERKARTAPVSPVHINGLIILFICLYICIDK